MRFPLSPCALAVALASLAPALIAQSPWIDTAEPQPAVRNSAAVQTTGPRAPREAAFQLGSNPELTTHQGQPWAGAPTYEAWFHADGIEFRPLSRSAEGASRALSFRLLSVSRGDQRSSVGTATREMDGDTVRYRRGNVIEEYQVRSDCIEQSFVFDRLPNGSGDLVVRGAIDTAFPVISKSADGLHFAGSDPEQGGVHIGRVLGLDAAGRRVEGSLDFAHGVLELRLPASFVDAATLPLVLDPPIGSTLTLTGFPTLDERDPDVAYDATTDRYAVTYERVVSGQRRIMIRRFDGAGALVGGTIVVRTPPAGVDAFDPRVAGLNLRDAFVVCWTENNDVLAVAVAAVDGALSNVVTVAGTADAEITPDIGGDATLTDDDCVVVWDNNSSNRIQARQVQLTSTFVLGAIASPVGIVDLVADSVNVGEPEIAKSGGAGGVYLAVWRRDFASTDSDIRGAIFDRNLNMVDSFVAIEGSTRDEDSPEVDGDGSRWAVVYEQAEATPDNGSDNVVCRHVELDGSGGRVDPAVLIEADVNDDEQNPAVAWCGDSCLIAAPDEYTSGSAIYDLYVRSVDPYTCLNCENRFSLEVSSTRDADYVRLCSTFHGEADPAADLAMIVWESLDATVPDGEIVGRLYRTTDGLVADLGGGCGNGGTLFATCAHQGNNGFALRLRTPTSSANAWLVLSPDVFGMTCGSCTLLPNPWTGYVLAATTDPTGRAEIGLAIPNSSALVGLTLYSQWLVAGGSCAALGVDFSNAVRITIQ